MLRQYGTAAPSSLTSVFHPEDAQPNERSSKRSQRLPPTVSTAPSARGGLQRSGHQRGGHHGRGPMHRNNAPFMQYATRGNSAWRERGRGQASIRGATRSYTVDRFWQETSSNYDTSRPSPEAPTSTSGDNDNKVHWRQQTGLSADAPTYFNARTVDPDQQRNWTPVNSNTLQPTTSTARSQSSFNHSQASRRRQPDSRVDSHSRSSSVAVSGHAISSTQSDTLAPNSTLTKNNTKVHWSRQADSSRSAPYIDVDAGFSGQPFSSSKDTCSATTSKHPSNRVMIHWDGPVYLPGITPSDINAGPSTFSTNASHEDAHMNDDEPPSLNLIQPPPVKRPQLPRKPPPTHWSRQQDAKAPSGAQSSTQTLVTTPHLHLDAASDKQSVSGARTASSPQPQLPSWLLRSRSPSPKLPPTPLKRRKLNHDFGSHLSSLGDITAPVTEPILSSKLPPIPRSKVPLPGRNPTPKTPIRVKEEIFSPVKAGLGVGPSVKQESMGPSVKKEFRSPSPAELVKPERRLITESTNRYPIPDSCKKTNPQFAQNRKAYFREKSRELLHLGLSKTKAFWRDDGLVIEWSSKFPVWSDTLKPDFPDLATAIQRAHELNQIGTSPRNVKRKRDSSVANAKSANQNDPDIIEVPGIGGLQMTEPPRKKDRKHPSTSIPLEEFERSENLAASSSTGLSAQENSSKRTLLPTRRQITKSLSDLPKPPFKLPDPTAPLPSQEWRAAAQKIDGSTRMVFKPTNPRKGQGGTLEVQRASPIESQDLSQKRQEAASRRGTPRSDGNGHRQLGHAHSNKTLSTSSELIHLSRASTPRDRPPHESAKSLTALDGCLSAIASANVLRNESEPVSESIAVSVENQCADSPADGEEDLDSETVALDLLRSTPDQDDFMSSDTECVDEDEIENSVQQFISKYASMFDFDRRNLKKAYAKDAIFSRRVHHAKPNSCASLFIPEPKDFFRTTQSRPLASQVIQGRTQICDELFALGQYQFIPRGVPQNPLYTWSIPKFSGVPSGILLTLHGEVVRPESNPALDHRLAVDQTLLLRRRTAEDDTDDDDGTDIPGHTNMRNFWPLAVVSHIMIARSIPLLSLEGVQAVDWIRDILQ